MQASGVQKKQKNVQHEQSQATSHVGYGRPRIDQAARVMQALKDMEPLADRIRDIGLQLNARGLSKDSRETLEQEWRRLDKEWRPLNAIACGA